MHTDTLVVTLRYILSPTISQTHIYTQIHVDGVQMRLRSYTEICFALLIQPIMKTHKTKKLSIEEKRRIQVLESFRAACSSSPSKRAH